MPEIFLAGTDHQATCSFLVPVRYTSRARGIRWEVGSRGPHWVEFSFSWYLFDPAYIDNFTPYKNNSSIYIYLLPTYPNPAPCDTGFDISVSTSSNLHEEKEGPASLIPNLKNDSFFIFHTKVKVRVKVSPFRKWASWLSPTLTQDSWLWKQRTWDWAGDY